ncbi:DNA repair protein Rad60-like [Maniola hyperantus]|uniref:DNA repair protein Rad60-like n=1 Tax=Aphantopus hyperantus TaxID=2795564 RepID=UPI00212E5AE5
MSSSDSDDGFYSNVNVFKNIRLAREQLRKDLECEEGSTNNTGKSHECSGTVENDVTVTKIAENLRSNTANDSLVDSVEDDLILDEIIAKNSKPARGRGRGRGRKKKETTVEPPKPPAVSNTRGRGRGRGEKRGRASKNNVTDTEISNALDTIESLNGTSNRRNGRNSSTSQVDNSMIANILNGLTGRSRGRGRKRRATYSPNSSVEEVLDGLQTGNVTRRGRSYPSRRCRGRGNQWQSIMNMVLPSIMTSSYPIYSVGNTDEYYDKSDDVPLFSKPTSDLPTKVTDDVVMLDNEETDAEDNEPLSVKVIWKSLDISKFTIRKYQKLTQIFDHFSQKENVGKDKLLFTYNNKILTCNDTPASIDYNIAKFIDGGVVSQSIKNIVHEKTTINGIQIKFQCQNSKKPVEITIGKDDKVSLAMTQCAERLELPLNKLKFEFDGDIVVGTNTPQQMGLENGDCIDVIILS